MLSRDNTGLIIVDVQGKLARLVENSSLFIANCEKLILGVKALDMPIVLLEQNPEKLGLTVEEIGRHLTHTAAITKSTFNACQSPTFLEAVQAASVDSWLVCGIEAHICVYQTARGLTELGYHVELVSDCISSRSATDVRLAIERLMRCGVEVTGLEMCLYELVKDCRDPAFKPILSLVR
ncbi:isochorismatase family protein [Vibrio sinaloensis]|uniref:Isochorismatase n=1 Tax=Photobacterium sp. (strain ATCC 43367) TaxID=379097 RepID=A0A0A5HTY3_PHOS4|nr:isochorismatase family protein [Vibrio sinaloensis]KGY07795.1 isochorismatase [Vibrio sinaloensis]